MQTFIEGIAIASKYQLQNQETFDCESEESCVTSQQTTDRFLSDSKTNKYTRCI